MKNSQYSRRQFLQAGAPAMCGGFLMQSWVSQVRGASQFHTLIWIEPKDFAQYGGWKLDTQFIDLMGSACLLAAGTGSPVQDATTAIRLPKAGNFRIWVRNKNWLQDYSPGRFRLAINGTPSDKVFGCGAAEKWIWESAGDYELKQGLVRFSLQDETGHYGRCAGIILTTDHSFVPPDDAEGIRTQRAQMTGVGLQAKVSDGWDVIVIGAGAAGFCAAIAAARKGAKTALIDSNPELGGNAYLGVPLNGATCCKPHARELGIVEEIGRVIGRYGVSTSSAMKRLAASESNLTLFPNQVVIGVDMADAATIAAVKTIGTLDNFTAVYKGKLFIDCSGDGWVGYYAGAHYRCGREARHEFNERLAPETADDIMMSGVLFREAFIYKAVDTGRPVVFEPPSWAYKWTSDDHIYRHVGDISYGSWWFEHRGTINELEQKEKARDDLLRITYGYWDYLKNTWSKRERAKNYALAVVATTLAKRETRRLIGDYILTQNDVQNDTFFEDRIASGGWYLDVHHPEGMFSGKEGPYQFNEHVALYQIPFRCLYSKNIANLLFAGRDMSVTHVALGTVRIQRTLACLGQAAGTAAALAVQHSLTPRSYAQQHMPELQQILLKDDVFIPHVRNQDPLDLARTAQVHASSVDAYQTFDKTDCQSSGYLPLDRPRAMVFPVGIYGKLESLFLQLSTTIVDASKITLLVREANHAADFGSKRVISSIPAVVPPGYSMVLPTKPPAHGFAHWVKFDMDVPITTAFVCIELPATEGIWWGRMAKAPLPSCRGALEAGKWVAVNNEYHSFYTLPAIVLPPSAHRTATDYAAENIINGLIRPDERSMNMWASDPRQAMPQWVELEFSHATTIDSVYLTFDTDLDVDEAHKSDVVPPECVREYQVSGLVGAEWKILADVTGNFQRRRIHRFAAVPVERLRVTVLATNGHRSARLYELRAYRESVQDVGDLG